MLKSTHRAAMAKMAEANVDLEKERDTERGIVATLQHRVHMLNVANDAEKAEGMDVGATKVLTDLAKILHVRDWSIQEGSETWEGDVWATMFRILVDAGVVEEDHHAVANWSDLNEARADAEANKADAEAHRERLRRDREYHQRRRQQNNLQSGSIQHV
jgi:hypothetical protein